MRFSVITTVFNRADCITKCIESVIRNQNNSCEVEHVIVDDGSSDRTAEIIKQYSKSNPHIKFIEFKKNRGTNAGRNAAIAAATGDFCVILDSDDYFVDDAINTIFSVIEKNPGYKHYMFAPDDCVEAYQTNPIINGAETKVLLYPDFLNGHITGDFIHVIKTETLRKFPFLEEIRTYEGLFFLQFYREAEKMFFCNHIVTIRDRGRSDSVSKEFWRTSPTVIKRQITYLEQLIQWFREDYLSLGMQKRLNRFYTELVENQLLCSHYDEAKKWNSELKANGGELPLRNKLVMTFHLGLLYRLLLKAYLITKYEILKNKFN